MTYIRDLMVFTYGHGHGAGMWCTVGWKMPSNRLRSDAGRDWIWRKDQHEILACYIEGYLVCRIFIFYSIWDFCISLWVSFRYRHVKRCPQIQGSSLGLIKSLCAVVILILFTNLPLPYCNQICYFFMIISHVYLQEKLNFLNSSFKCDVMATRV